MKNPFAKSGFPFPKIWLIENANVIIILIIIIAVLHLLELNEYQKFCENVRLLFSIMLCVILLMFFRHSLKEGICLSFSPALSGAFSFHTPLPLSC